MERPWHYSDNQFLNTTETNFIKGLKLAEFTDAQLLLRSGGDPFANAQYAILHPLYDTFNTEFDSWFTQKGTQKGSTVTMYDLLNELGETKIDDWDLAVQSAGIRKGSANYTALFPQGHDPFQKGPIISRINSVNALSGALALQIPPGAPPTHPLVILKGDVDAFYTSINDARTAQEGQKGSTTVESAAVNTARINAMTGLYAFLGACINHYAATPSQIDSFFDLKTLRSHKQLFFKGHVVVNGPHTVAKRKVEADALLKLKNPGVTPLKYYLAGTKGAQPPAAGGLFVEVPAGEENEVPASDLGNVDLHHYLIVFNPDLINRGQWEVDFQ